MNTVELRHRATDLASEAAGPKRAQTLQVRRSPLATAAAQRALLDQLVLPLDASLAADGAGADLPAFERALCKSGQAPLLSSDIEVVQVNLGKLCNMTCRHCHVDAGPDRTDAMMDEATIEAVMRAIECSGAKTVDLTGGAPELHPAFRRLVQFCVDQGKHVIDRCNLTVLLLPKYRDLAAWMAERGVEVVASLPHYRRLNTDAQRGQGTFVRSIEALRCLNQAGYGQGQATRCLTLMSNPAGAFLGGTQQELESEWKAGLMRYHGVSFDRLFVLNNMPIARFLEWLLDTDNLQAYMELLVNAFNPWAVPGLMCRNTLSVAWDGSLYDCDFNQMLEIPAVGRDGRPLPSIHDFDPERLPKRPIGTGRHCFGCTAGAGSSCGGATS